MKRKRIDELDENLKAAPVEETTPWRWVNAATARVEKRGLAWFEENQASSGRAWARIPHRAQSTVSEGVRILSQMPTSAHLAFRSDTTRLAIRAKTEGTEVVPHMAVTGTRGLQLYCGSPGQMPHLMRPIATALPDPQNESFERPLFQNLEPKLREFRLYLPLYAALDSLELGLDRGAKLMAPSALAIKKPVVFYGTSITQGGCASAAGHDFVSQVGRKMNVETINLGFSGNGKGEPVMARLLAEIDASLYVLDYAGNVDAAQLRRTLPRFVDILREARPGVPILLQTVICYAHYGLGGTRWKELEELRDVMFDFYCARRKRGDRDIHIVDGFCLVPFGVDGAFVDGGHPTDHGFTMMAEQLVPVIQRILCRDI